MSEIESKPKYKFVEVNDIPPIHERNSMYDEAVSGALNATKDTIQVQFDGKVGKQVYSVLHSRIQEYNLKPDRECDLLLAQRKDVTYIKRLPKDSLAQTK